MSKMSVNVQVASELPGASSSYSKTPKEEEKEEKQRIFRVDQYYSRKNRQTHYAKTTKEDVKTRERFRKYALVVRRIIDPRGLPQGTEIDIKSPKLVEVLKDIFKNVEKFRLAESEKSPVVSPSALFLAWDQLEARKAQEKSKESPDTRLLDDLSVALAYLEQDFGSTYSQLKGLVGDGFITFDLLRSFFKPSSALYTDKNDLQEDQVMKFAWGGYEQKQSGEKSYVVHASIITHDGENLGWAKTKIVLPFFEGKMSITGLDVFPLDNHPEQESIRQRLTNRGHNFISFLKEPVCKWYGATATYSKQHGLDWEEVKFLASKRVMIDPPTWIIHNHSWDVLRYPIVADRTSLQHPMRNEDLLFCHHRILGFSFEPKRWGAFAVSKLEEPRWNEAAFDKVILPSDQLHLIKDLVFYHRTQPKNDDSRDDSDDDIIKGKGKGLIGLLSGSPGVGKTLTAEAVAEVSKRPLYTVSAGEMGTKISTVDENLGQVLDITRRWGCMLLIDEADVFLHKRDDNVSLERNAIVSIFLRRLEYFCGVAILTTNRKIDIDVAFMSRIHFKFHYKDLDSHALSHIWRNFLGKEVLGPKRGINDTDLQRLAQMYTLSGREIKNAAFCAKSISSTRGQALSLQLVRDIIDNLGFVSTVVSPNPGSPRKGGLKRAAVHEENAEAGQLRILEAEAGPAKRVKRS